MRRLAVALMLFATTTALHAQDCAELFADAERIGGLRDRDSAGGIAAAEAGLDRARAAGCVEAEAEMHASLADNLNVAGRRDESIEHYRSAVALLEPLGETEQLAAVLRREAITHAGAGDYTTAVARSLHAYRISIALGDESEAAMTAGNLGTMYSRLQDFERAREYLELAHQGFIAAGNRVSAAGTGINLGSLLMRQADGLVANGDADGARALRERALAHNLDAARQFEEMDHLRGLSMAVSNAGVAYNLLGDHDAALPLHHRALEVRQRVGDHDGRATSHLHLAQSYIPLERFDEAESHLETASELVVDRSLMLQGGVAEKWVELEEARDRPAAALERMRSLNRIRDQIAAADHQSRVAEIQARYDSAEQAARIQRLQHHQEISTLRLQRQRAWLTGGTILVALLVLGLATVLGWQRLARRHTRDMEQAARTDELTGLANRRGARDRIEYEVKRARRSGKPFALAVLDIDGFKAINDQHGHEAGDQLLVAVARRIVSAKRQQDTVARWGGDELLLLLPETDEAGAMVLARKIGAKLSATPIRIHDALHTVTLTVGVSQYWPSKTLDECIRAADDAMYRGKKTGKDKVVSSRGENLPGISDP
ncbi:MAG: diguanylate cyclase [Xanthomonadaceae bacterium]|nr:diguanylate cyclase [Xanthomonadaceae bacterium]